MKRVRLYWMYQMNNFGDCFTVYLLTHYFGYQVRYAEPGKAEMVGAGSIIGKLPNKFDGIVFGTGKMNEDTSLPQFAKGKVLGLRGRLTAGDMDVPLFDPGILSFLFYKPRAKKYKLGVIPHFADKGLSRKYPGSHVIRIFDSVPDVINEIGACEQIVSSSLHGLIAAASLGVPNSYAAFYHSKHYKSDFKIRDYLSVPVDEAKQAALKALGKLRLML